VGTCGPSNLVEHWGAKSNSEMKSLADHSLGHYSVRIRTKNSKITCFIALYGSYWGLEGQKIYRAPRYL